MKKGITYIILTITAILLLNGKMLARQSATAVMEVKVEVISATKITSHFEEISSQLQLPDEEGDCELEIARYELSVPDGVNYMMSVSEGVTVRSDKGEMMVELSVDEIHEADGSSVLFLNGVVNTRGVSYGMYIGDQRTTIEYD